MANWSMEEALRMALRLEEENFVGVREEAPPRRPIPA